MITAAVLLVTAAVTYGFIALYTPGRYLIAVEENISREAEDLVGEIEKSNKDDAQKLLEQFINLRIKRQMLFYLLLHLKMLSLLWLLA